MRLSIVCSNHVDMGLSSLISNVETAVRPFRQWVVHRRKRQTVRRILCPTKQRPDYYYVAFPFTILRLVNSSRRECSSFGHRGTVVSPILSVTSPSAEEVREAIHRSQTVFQSGVWSRASTLHRSMILSKLARSLESRITGFAQLESQQTGRTIREMQAQLGRLPEWL